MNRLLFICICILCSACQTDNYKKVDAESIAEKELKTINFKEVDQFPLFKSCDETVTRLSQQKCFEKNLHKWLKPHVDSLDYDTKLGDTLKLFLSVTKKGELQCDSLHTKLSVHQQFEDIFANAPKIFPAQKRGVPVKVSFQLPLILNVNQTL